MPKKMNRRKQTAAERAAQAKEVGATLARKVAPLVLVTLIALGLPYGVFELYMYAVSSERFEVKHVHVEGATHVKQAELMTRGEVALGMNIFDVDEERAARLIEQLDWVASATVERELPDRVKVRVMEHEPVAVVLDEGGWSLVDVQGAPFKRIQGQDASRSLISALPLITGLDVEQLAAPSGALERARLAEAQQVYAMYGAMGLDKRAPLSEVHIDPVLGISLILAEGGAEIRLGWGRWQERLVRLAAVQDALATRGTEYDYILIDQEESLHRVTVGPAQTKDR
jgi:cell division protein FtsQ